MLQVLVINTKKLLAPKNLNLAMIKNENLIIGLDFHIHYLSCNNIVRFLLT